MAAGILWIGSKYIYCEVDSIVRFVIGWKSGQVCWLTLDQSHKGKEVREKKSPVLFILNM